MRHEAIQDAMNGGTRGCTCGWESQPFRSDKQTWHQWVEHKVSTLPALEVESA